MGRLVRWVLTLLVVVAGGWTVWWFSAAAGQQAALEGWLEDRSDAGWLAEAKSIEVNGFPEAFRMRVDEIALADPRTGWSWEAPELRAESPTFTPTRVAVTWPEAQSIAVPGERAELVTTRFDTLIDFRPGPSMELRETNANIAGLEIAGQTGWTAGAQTLDLRLIERPSDLAPPNSYDLKLDAKSLRLPEALVRAIDPTGLLSPAIDSVVLSGHAALADPLDRHALEDGKLALRAATIRDAGFAWGEMELSVTGSVIVDDQGFPEGELSVTARDWRQMVDLAHKSGIIGKDLADGIETALGFVSALSGGGDDLETPLTLAGGKVRIGPVPIADAPRVAPPRS